ncbi:MAG: phosphopantetheine-binding protein [Bryobacterales bacterium]|nr:phosphopantetheine-binding protein [Bryobacterales bacterium]
MSSTADRLRKLVGENLEVDGQPIDLPQDLNISLLEAGVSSMDLVAFAKLVSQEFDITFSPEECTRLGSVREVAEFIDSQAG